MAGDEVFRVRAMRRALAIFVFVALASSAALAQFTTVSGTVTDPNGLPYANGSISVALVSSGTPKFTATNQPYTPPSQPVGLSSAGSFIMQLADVTALTPGGSTYNFTVSCAAGCVPVAGGKGPITFTVTGITISGASQSITATLTAAAPALASSGGGGTPAAPVNSIQFNNTGAFGGDPQFTWNPVTHSHIIGPTTNIGYLNLGTVTPTVYSETTSAGQNGTTGGPFTIPYDFSGYLNGTSASSTELFSVNAMAAVLSGAVNFTSEIVGLHGEGDHNATGTVANLGGVSGEGFNLGPGAVTFLYGDSATVGILSTAPGTGTVTQAVGLNIQPYAQQPLISSGFGIIINTPQTTGCPATCMTNWTALQIGNPGVGGIANPLAINVAAGQNNLGPGLTQAGTLNVTTAGSTSAPSLYWGITGGTNPMGIRASGSAGTSALTFAGNNADTVAIDIAFGITQLGAGGIGISGSNLASRDVALSRAAAKVFNVGNGTLGNTTGSFKASGYQSLGTKFTASGCTNGTLLGGATAGQFTVGQNTACTIVITMGDSDTAPNGWTCNAYDLTAVPAVAIRETATNTTSCSLLMTVATNDVIVWSAMGW